MAVGLFVLFPIVISLAAGKKASTNPAVTWPTKGWPKGTPGLKIPASEVWLDESLIVAGVQLMALCVSNISKRNHSAAIRLYR